MTTILWAIPARLAASTARWDETLKSFEERVEGMAAFLERTQGLKGDAAKQAAFSYLTKMPA